MSHIRAAEHQEARYKCRKGDKGNNDERTRQRISPVVKFGEPV